MYHLAATKLPSKPDFKYDGFECHFSRHQAAVKSARDVSALSRQLYGYRAP